MQNSQLNLLYTKIMLPAVRQRVIAISAAPRRSLPTNLSQLGIGRRANKKSRPIIAGQGYVGSDTKLLCMRFCCRTGSTPRHPNTLSLFRYEYKDDSAASCRSRNFHDKALSVSSPDQGNLDMAKIVCVLYDDPVDGYPKSYPRDDLPKIEHYPDGQTLPTPKAIDFKPGALLGSVSGELGLRKYLESNGHTFVVTSDKDGPSSVFERELPDADIVISQPFWPAYLTAERIAKAKKLKLAITAGIGSDHVDLQAAIERGVTVAEVTYSNSISVSEHVVMMILARAQLHPLLPLGGEGRLEYRRLRRALL